jgi:glucan phosphoethanolaminetransferase (alkaline phosphatase superfamily)
MDAVNNYDINLVHKAIEHYNSNGQIILLHSLGSHFKYSIRYPSDFSYFLPASKPTDGYDILNEENKSLLINTYDNSIRYTDYVLHQLISWMNSLDNAAILIYISDHGESFWDDERKLSLHGSYELNEAEYHVPCFIWYSNEFLQQQPQKIHTLEDNKHIPQNSSTIFHTLLHLADIVEIVDSTKSLCSTYVQPLDSFQVLSGDGEIKTYIIQ